MQERARPGTEVRFGRWAFAATVVGLVLLFAGCGGDDIAGPPIEEDQGFVWDLPPGFPEPRVPDDNPMTNEKVELGLHLFYDKRLSGNQTQSCSSCHQQALAFTDGRKVALGSTGVIHPRSTMSLTNVAYQPVLTWADPTQTNFAHQVVKPLFGQNPVELGLAGMEEELFQRLRADETYQVLFSDAYPDEEDPYRVGTITKAIGSFLRTLVSGNSPEDRFRGGDEYALSQQEQQGRELFFSDRLQCSNCHRGVFFTGTFDHRDRDIPSVEYLNNALYNLDENGSYPEPNTGLFHLTERPTDMGRFKAPTLRNIAVTAPYMHDGSIATLDEVLDHYAAGGRTITSGPNAGVGSENPHKSPLMSDGFTLTDEERSAVLEYLHALTDEEFITDPRFSNPWPDGSAAHGVQEAGS